MDRENDLVFCEVQRFGLLVRLMFVASLTIAMVMEVVLLKRMIFEQGLLEIFPIILFIVTMIIIPILVAILFLVVKLEAEVRSDGLYVRFFPAHIRFKRFAAEDLTDCFALKYRPILEYGGWGIRFGKKGKAYNVSGNRGVQLVLKNGKRLLIGSQRPDELAEAINSIMSGA